MKSQQATPTPSRLRWLLCTTVITLCAMLAPHPAQAQATPDVQTAPDTQAAPDTKTAKQNVYLPMIVGGEPGVARESAWQLSAPEQQVEALFLSDPEQHRQNSTPNAILSSVARARAADMAQQNYFSHTSPDGHGPNYWVTQAGYALPSYYTDNGNNIESIGLNYSTGDQVWDAWKHSAAHRVHVLGEDPFYATQTDYGIGYAESANSRYWVLITAQH